MSASETTVTRTVLYEAAQIGAMRAKVAEAERRIDREGEGHALAVWYGRLAESLSVVDDALFNVLNIAANLLECDESKAALAVSRARAEAAREAS